MNLAFSPQLTLFFKALTRHSDRAPFADFKNKKHILIFVKNKIRVKIIFRKQLFINTYKMLDGAPVIGV